jgi:hypothetical protein
LQASDAASGFFFVAAEQAGKLERQRHVEGERAADHPVAVGIC